MFITLEDETDVANLIVWPSVLEKQRGIVIGAQMLACRGRVQKAAGVIHVIAEHLIDHSDRLRAVGEMDRDFTIRAGCGDKVKHGHGLDPREAKAVTKTRDIYIPRTVHRHAEREGAEFPLGAVVGAFLTQNRGGIREQINHPNESSKQRSEFELRACAYGSRNKLVECGSRTKST